MDPRDVTTEHFEGAPAPRDDLRPARLGFVAHEIRNPLATALWTAELLTRMTSAERGGARGEKLSATCLRSITRVRQLVEDHFLCERLDVGGLPLRLEGVGARDVVQAVLQKRPAAAGPTDAEIPAELALEADRGLLERALEAIVAVAGAEQTPVRVTARATAEEVALVVEGRPADPAALVDPTKGSPSDHAGRALAIPVARRIAEALAGRLATDEGRWVLTLRRSRAYTAPRPTP
jgi:K+-sensing histidine kinase KdpD